MIFKRTLRKLHGIRVFLVRAPRPMPSFCILSLAPRFPFNSWAKHLGTVQLFHFAYTLIGFVKFIECFRTKGLLVLQFYIFETLTISSSSVNSESIALSPRFVTISFKIWFNINVTNFNKLINWAGDDIDRGTR